MLHGHETPGVHDQKTRRGYCQSVSHGYIKLEFDVTALVADHVLYRYTCSHKTTLYHGITLATDRQGHVA
jgi:hypothetical protein